MLICSTARGGASLVTAVFARRKRLGQRASRRMNLALLPGALSATLMLLAAMSRSANRQCHVTHPELVVEGSQIVLLEWTTRIAGAIAAGMHLLGWSLLLLASAAWSTRMLPRALAVLYSVGGLAAMFVCLQPEPEGLPILLGVVWSCWQAVLLLKARDPVWGSRGGDSGCPFLWFRSRRTASNPERVPVLFAAPRGIIDRSKDQH